MGTMRWRSTIVVIVMCNKLLEILFYSSTVLHFVISIDIEAYSILKTTVLVIPQRDF